MTIRSRYRIIPLLLILLINSLFGWISGLLIYLFIKDPTFLSEMPPGPVFLVSMIFLLELLLLNILFKDCRRIKVNKEKIVFINPLLPFIRKSYKWRKLDYHLTVIERSTYGGAFENTWLIRKGRVKARISSFYFANYMDIKDALSIPDQGERSLTWFQKFTCRYGWTRIPRYFSRYRS
ncbi:MAG: hypothetical protein LUE93_09375 [Bacteroides sp.]|nr:hypothetical protein [Bacteroides sp.]